MDPRDEQGKIWHNGEFIEWKDATEGIPAFLTLVIIPYSFSISSGIAFGFISYSLVKLLTGRWRECPLLVYVFALLFLIQFYFNS